jgi:hypothetical protein
MRTIGRILDPGEFGVVWVTIDVDIWHLVGRIEIVFGEEVKRADHGRSKCILQGSCVGRLAFGLSKHHDITAIDVFVDEVVAMDLAESQS